MGSRFDLIHLLLPFGSTKGPQQLKNLSLGCIVSDNKLRLNFL